MTTTDYDRLPYDGLPFGQTHPDRLAVLARLHGLDAPDPASARVLELGCGLGYNLIPLAYALPGAEFVGLDLSAGQIATGRAAVAAIGLTNLQLQAADLRQIDPSWGKFDFILCHGVFSWVPPPVQDHILRICRENLTPAGVAFISYNALPGWHWKGAVRDMLLYRTAGLTEPAARLAAARSYLDFLATHTDASTPHGQHIRALAEKLRQEPDAYVFHEYLESDNRPLYFHEFVRRAAAAGLDYRCEAEIAEALTERITAETQQALAPFAPDPIAYEQHLDFLRNRMFRQSLLVHAGRPAGPRPNPAAIRDLILASEAEAQPAPDGAVAYSVAGKSVMTTNLPWLHNAMAELRRAWPQGVAFTDLWQRLGKDAPSATAAKDAQLPPIADALPILLRAVAIRLLDLRTHRTRAVPAPGPHPEASAVARHQARTSLVVTDLLHRALRLDPWSQQVLLRADGQHSPAAIAPELVPLVRAGQLPLRPADANTQDLPHTVASYVTGILQALGPRAILVG